MITIPKDKTAFYTLVDLAGKTIKTGTIDASSDIISTEGLQEGMYFIQLRTTADQHVKTLKFVKN